MMSQTSEWAEENILLGDFRVERILGSGGMGAVYLVRSCSTGYQYAVKRSHIPDLANRRQFLTELLTWIDLPDHPLVAACRFFRSVEQLVVVFAEFVSGGSLSDWIRTGRLNTLEEILDVAIQFAWGLHVIHELGLVHQDVKPGNVLITEEGLTKITDFGLARARAVARIESVNPESSILVSAELGTRGYRSPEQADGLSLSRKTDMWSWGLSVLEMFRGSEPVADGQAASDSLDIYLQNGPDRENLPAMPEGVIEILRRCFRDDPTERWATMLDTANALKVVYREALGRDYPRSDPLFPTRPPTQAIDYERVTSIGEWIDPQYWLTYALQVEGRDLAEAELLLFRDVSYSRKARAVADLIGYDEVYVINHNRIARGDEVLQPAQAMLCLNKAVVHGSVGDVGGMLELSDEAISLLQPFVQHLRSSELAAEAIGWAIENETVINEAFFMGDASAINLIQPVMEDPEVSQLVVEALSWILLNNAIFCKANALIMAGELERSIQLYDYVTQTLDSQLQTQRHRSQQSEATRRGREQIVIYLAEAHQNKAQALQMLGRFDQAMREFDRALQLWATEVSEPSRRAFNVASISVPKARLLLMLNRVDDGLDVCNQGIALLEPFASSHDNWQTKDILARLYLNKAGLLLQRRSNPDPLRTLANSIRNWFNPQTQVDSDLNQLEAAADQSIQLWEPLVREYGRNELSENLGKAYTMKGIALRNRRNPQEAQACLEQAIQIFEQLVYNEGRQDLFDELARACLNQANSLDDAGIHEVALRRYNQTIELRSQLMQLTNHPEVALGLAQAYYDKAVCLVRIAVRTNSSEEYNAHLQDALNHIEQSIDRYRHLVANGWEVAQLRLRRAEDVRARILSNWDREA
jgi:serine/threonine protein kinase